MSECQRPLPFGGILSVLFTIASLLQPVCPASGQDVEGAHQRDQREQPQPVFPQAQPEHLPRKAPNALTHVVHGYHPYWISDDAVDLYRLDLLSHVAYFSCEIDPASGLPTNTRGWLTSTVPARAKAAGVKVLLTVTNFGAGANRTLLANPVACDTLCAVLVRLVHARAADGVSIDFESVPADQRDNFTTFFAKLRNALDAYGEGMIISAAAPAVDWSGSWDVSSLAEYIDLFFIMGYDYSWSGSTAAGPVAPLRGFSLNVEKSVDWYLSHGVPAEKFLLGVPYYGYDWPVQDDRQQSPATDRANARIYSVIPDILAHFPRQWSESYSVPWIAYRPSAWRQCWYDDAQSLGLKYAFAKERNLGGVGMWALGYDGVLPELWEELRKAFTTTTRIDAAWTSVHSIELWPQPLRRGESFALGAVEPGLNQAYLYDVLGRRVWSAVLPATSTLRCPDVVPGMYMLRLVTHSGIAHKSVIVE
ncbi:MAG: glycosyl hydrolase family 18 protein [Bacteroidia bacterium]|nr:glycosyl hydrolase family 18 protein [Bacteroidia bacterium]